MTTSLSPLNLAVSFAALSANQMTPGHAFHTPLNTRAIGRPSSTSTPALARMTPLNANFPQRQHNQHSLNQHSLRQAPFSPSLQPKHSTIRSRTSLQGSVWPDSDYPEASLKTPLALKFEPLGQSAYPIYQAASPEVIPEFPAENMPNTAAVDLTQLLSPGTVYIAFTDSQAHLGEVTDEGSLQKLDLPDCPFSKAQILKSDGADYSGLYLVPADLPTALKTDLHKAAEQMRSQPVRGSINTIGQILTQAGCTLNTDDPSLKLTNYHSQTDLLTAIMQHGLSYQGTPIPARFINTTPEPLQQLKDKMDHAAFTGPIKHLQALLQSPDTKKQRQAEASAIRGNTPKTNQPDHKDKSLTEDFSNPIHISSAKTSPTGALLRRHVSPHVLFNIELNREQTAKQLPQRLKPFDQKNPDLITRLKKDVLFPPSVAKKVHNLMAESFDTPRQISGADLLSLLTHQGQPALTKTETKTDFSETAQNSPEPQRYNCVITDNKLVLGQVKAGCEAIDDVLSKHVLLAEYGEARFAGEIYVKDDTLYLTRNSGTYRPTETHLKNAVTLLSKQFPNLTVKGDFTSPG